MNPTSITRSERGSTIVLVSLSMTALLSIVALAVDVGMLLDVRTEAQRTADAAALAGAGTFLMKGDLDAADEDIARAEAIDIGGQNLVYGDSAEILPDDVEVDLEAGRVTVTVRRVGDRGNAIPTWFANVFGVGEADVAARATAQVDPAGSATCLKPSAPWLSWWTKGRCDSWDFRKHHLAPSGAQTRSVRSRRFRPSIHSGPVIPRTRSYRSAVSLA